MLPGMQSTVGRTAGAGWEIGVSRTLPHPPRAVWRFLTGAEGTALWLGAGARLPDEKGDRYRTADGTGGELRSRHELDRVRLTYWPAGWDHDTTLQVTVTGSGKACTLRFHQERLAGAAERERQREHWRAVLDRVAAALAAG